MNDDYRRPGRHSFDAEPRWPVADHDPSTGPQWPAGDDARWPPAHEPGPERPSRETPRRRPQPPPRRPAAPGAPGAPGAAAAPGARSGPTRVGRYAAGAGAPPPGPPRRPRRPDPVDTAATEMLPPINPDAYQVSPAREPELLTHRYHDNGGQQPAHDPAAEQRINALLAESGGEPEPADDLDDEDLSPEELKSRKRRRIRRVALACAGLFIVLPLVAFTIAYFLVDIPSPQEVAAAQSKTVTYYFDDRKTVLGKDSQDGNRVILKPEQIPDKVKHAVYAAEDASFETNSGFDVSGILRAAKNQLTGGSGGGSTITQQYIKQATGEGERTITRKGLEIVKAFKMNNELSKTEIITAYLNTIYFGRGAYGVQAASEAYFGKDVSKLSASQAAYLAGIIQAPSRGDTREYAETRWTYVIGQMDKHNWLPADEQVKFPKIINPKNNQVSGFNGPRAYLKSRITEELKQLKFDENQVRLEGYKIYTTIDERAQRLAEETVADVMEGEPRNLREALVAVDPKTGSIKAYYGGPNDQKDQQDWANTASNPGSAIKPFDFVGLLKKDKGPYTTYDGSSPRTFPGVGVEIHNSEGNQCPNPCSVMKAMEQSVNTVFYDMVVNDVKARGVVKALKEAGVSDRSRLNDRYPDIAIGGRDNKITPRDMAAAYATFAADGIQRDSHFVSKITTPDGEVVYQANQKGKPAFDPDREKSKQIAGNVTKTLEPVLPYSSRACAGGRDCAGKTGTHQYEPPKGKPDNGDNAQAWTAGYTRQLSAAAWVGTGYNEPIKDMTGGKIYGRGLPGAIWKQFMDAYHQGMPNEPFPEVKLIGAGPPPPPPPPKQTSDNEKPSEKPSDDKPSDKPDKPDKPTTTRPPDNTEEPTPTCGRPICPGDDEDPEPDPEQDEE